VVLDAIRDEEGRLIVWLKSPATSPSDSKRTTIFWKVNDDIGGWSKLSLIMPSFNSIPWAM
jgi:hypothetical protein